VGFLDFLRRDELHRIAELVDEVARLEAEVDVLAERFDDCSADRSLLLAEVNEAARTIVYLEGRVASAYRLMSSMLSVPRFKSYTIGKQGYNPWGDAEKPCVIKSIVDESYYCLDDSSWRAVLDRVYSSYKRVYGKWVKETQDCDNFADVAFNQCNRAMQRYGFDHLLCFGWARSRSHAFNVYRCKDGVWWVWEPQTGETVGKLGETVEPYVVTEVRI